LVRGFKSATTSWINEQQGTRGSRIWQRNYHEHIIRDQDELRRIREYIRDNPAQWHQDRENPTAGLGAQ